MGDEALFLISSGFLCFKRSDITNIHNTTILQHLEPESDSVHSQQELEGVKKTSSTEHSTCLTNDAGFQRFKQILFACGCCF